MKNTIVFIGAALFLCCTGSHVIAQTSDDQNNPASPSTQSAAEANNPAVTPHIQSGQARDLKLLAAIRRAVVRDQSLSADGHNVQVMVSNGIVTLRGPVDSDTEKNEIEGVVTSVAGVSSIDNELEIDDQ